LREDVGGGKARCGSFEESPAGGKRHDSAS
jgi:hypothetical protein